MPDTLCLSLSVSGKGYGWKGSYQNQ